ncbi:MAG: nucleotide exchange factor GrpE [Lachnospiraceae bacterium]|nr:nucleotide exchange factor GrpE [Lachnospiraceae bacterium]
MEEKETRNNTDEQVVEETAAEEQSVEESEKIDAAELENEEAQAEEEVCLEDAEEGDSEDTSGKEKRSFFKKKEKKKDERDEKIAELNDRIIRNMAEFDNFRKRTEKEKSQMFDIGAKSIVEKILPVIDNFERGIAALGEEEKQGAFAVGMEKVYKQLLTTLEAAGVKPIEAVGKEFDPNFHNAVMHIEDEELGENIVAEELQKGYLYHDTVVRYSMVKVAN